jgi:hypothetical protein
MCPLILLGVMLVTSCAAATDTAELVLPVVVNGYVEPPKHFQTMIRIVNLSATAVDVTFEAFRNDGTAVRILELFPIARTGTTTIFRLDPSGAVEAFTYGDVPSFNGWARLTFDSAASIAASAEVALIDAPPRAHPICQRPSSEIVWTFQAQGVRSARKLGGFAASVLNRRSAYALVNPSPTVAATLFLSLLDLSGKLVASSTVELAPQARTSRFLSELFTAPPADFIGSLRITGSVPLAAGAANSLMPEGRFAALPLEALSSGACTQVVTPARNPLTGECRSFPTPCDVPEGWEKVASCK